ncbi:MAG TPA: penicillin-binding protein 2 [Candidatus Paceibacterota bacterium]|nr:penicillin-binding protein 2 [Candidatus Paceibacterota bacterium]
MKPDVRLRTRILSGAFVFFALLLVVRLYFVQIVHGAQYRAQGMGQYVEPAPDTENRGDIYFTTKDGQLVAAATMQTGWRIAIDPEMITDASAAYKEINAIVPVDQSRFMASAAKKTDPYEEVAFKVSDADAAQIRALKIPGVMLVQDQWRMYPGGDLAAQTVGFVAYQGDSTSRVGVYGLEKGWNSTLELTGNGLYVNPFAEIFTNVQSALSTNPSETQGSIITSIEPNVQDELQKVLEQVMQEYTPDFAGGIIMDPHTGAIYAMGQEPSFDPNTYNLVTDPSVFSNILVSGRYEMGSIMKPLTMAAGIDSGAVTTATTYDDTGCITRSTYKICNYDFKARGVIPMQQILNQSLNVGASFVADTMGHPVQTDYFHLYGLGEKTGIDVPDEISGDLSNLGNGNGPDVNYDTASFGQGITVTPIEMIRALSVLANNGQLPDPHVVTGIKYESGITRSIPTGEGPQVLKPSSAETVTRMLEEVYDTALLNGKIKMDHYTVAAKTGTAQIPDPQTGGYIPGNVYLHSFFGYFPASDPKFIVFLFAYKPHGQEYASATLAMPFYQIAQFLINYYNIPPDR